MSFFGIMLIFFAIYWTVYNASEAGARQAYEDARSEREELYDRLSKYDDEEDDYDD